MCTYRSSSRRTPAASATVRIPLMETMEVRGFMKGKSTIAFKDELDHVAYHIYFSFVVLFGLMFHIREG